MKVNSEDPNKVISRIAAAIGEPARVRILSCLLDGLARTSTELAVVAEVKPSTTSVHLNRLKTERLVKLVFQGRHRYYSLNGSEVANALEALSLVAGYSQKKFVPNTPTRLVLARTCYDHLAGKLGVALFSHFAGLVGLPRKGTTATSAVQSSNLRPGVDLVDAANSTTVCDECLLERTQATPSQTLGAALCGAEKEVGRTRLRQQSFRSYEFWSSRSCETFWNQVLSAR